MQTSFALRLAAGSAACLLAASAMAGDFEHLVVMRVSTANVGGSGAVVLAEYSTAGIATGNLVALPTSGADAVSMPDLVNHDRHMHRSSDGRFLTFIAYGAAPGATDPSGQGAAAVARVVGIMDFNGVVDLSTRLTDAYDFTSIRSAASTDGDHLWISGDNASGGTASGGLRYTTRGSSTTVNISQVQVFGGSRTPDNVRDAAIFDGQLYDCSGSSASIGKGVFRVGEGLPTSGAQPLSAPLNGNDGASASSFYLLDLDAAVQGVDVLYTAASAVGVGVHKYVKQANGTWASRGVFPFAAIEDVIAHANTDGTVTLYIGSPSSIATFTDPAPLSGSLSSSLSSSTIITAAEGYSLGGFDFAPADSCAADFDGDGFVTGVDFDLYVGAFESGDTAADFDGDGFITGVDFDLFVGAYEAGC